MLFDSHCHLDDPSLADRIDEVVAAAKSKGVTRMLNPGVRPEGWGTIIRISGEYPCILPAVGLHPMYADLWSLDVNRELSRYAETAVAIGEIGLDYLFDIPKEVQQEVFREQLRIAICNEVPVLIHCRRAFPDLLYILREEEVHRVGGVMHAFSGSVEVAQECIRLGLYISVAGTITYANAVRPLELARRIPLENMLIETDAPDMSPEPYRKEINEPARLHLIAERLAEIKGMEVTEVAAVTYNNAERLFLSGRKTTAGG
jgi:TatD DNase family protein